MGEGAAYRRHRIRTGLFEPKSLLPGNGIFRAETKRSKRLRKGQGHRGRDNVSLNNPAYSGLVAENREISVSVGVRGGAERNSNWVPSTQSLSNRSLASDPSRQFCDQMSLISSDNIVQKGLAWPCRGIPAPPSAQSRRAGHRPQRNGQDRRRSPRSPTSRGRSDDRAWHTAARCSRGCAKPDEPTTAARRGVLCAPNDEGGPVRDHGWPPSLSQSGSGRHAPGSTVSSGRSALLGPPAAAPTMPGVPSIFVPAVLLRTGRFVAARGGAPASASSGVA